MTKIIKIKNVKQSQQYSCTQIHSCVIPEQFTIAAY